jgi:hypothetical protein
MLRQDHQPGAGGQSLYGSNSSAPAMATPIGVSVCRAFTDSRWKPSTFRHVVPSTLNPVRLPKPVSRSDR